MSGDTLWDIAGKYLGDPKRWTEIYNANREAIEAAAREHLSPPVNGTSDHGHWIFPGLRLQIPGMACLAPKTPPATSGLPLDCSKPLVIGVRGSGEPAVQNPYDLNLGPNAGAIAEDLKGKGALVYGLPYAAAPVAPFESQPNQSEFEKQVWKYWRMAGATEGNTAEATANLVSWAKNYLGSLRGGVEQLEGDIVTRATECSTQKIVLTGYSQGAWVIRMALDALSHRPDWNEVKDRISGIGLLADPFNDFFGPKLPAGTGPTFTVCAPEDPVCNNPFTTPHRDRCFPNLTILCPHLRYGTETTVGTNGRTGTQALADFLSKKL
ncbi:cutinase family protein [Streptomyces sp. NPDC016566]|uniref:cutinase family protein n=1 Tax=Streptomyces sp. NPDC016566 TaxID=3364967 RepID=UPI0036F92D2B